MQQIRATVNYSNVFAESVIFPFYYSYHAIKLHHRIFYSHAETFKLENKKDFLIRVFSYQLYLQGHGLL